jgi:Flp pilus assembly protein TadD
MTQSTTVKALMVAVLATVASAQAFAGDVKIPLPKRSQLTPVQRLNREGVEAVNKHQYGKAKSLFYKAYLYDPSDPFTLNNLGYIAELEGQVERAQSFYTLASQQTTDAAIDRSSLKKLEGKPYLDAVTGVHDVAMQINRSNVEAVRLLSEGRGPEADMLLQRTLQLDPKNVFTINNMGVAKEMEGDLEAAEKYYSQAAATRASDPVVVTLSKNWRGKPVSEMAEESTKRVKERMKSMNSPEERAALLNLKAVSAINRNEWRAAAPDFLAAYKLDPYNAFTLNNVGYVAEMEGDLETAQVFYEKAKEGDKSNAKVGSATRYQAEGMKVGAVADESDGRVDARMEEDQKAKQKETGPIRLKRRDNTEVVEPDKAPEQPQQ